MRGRSVRLVHGCDLRRLDGSRRLRTHLRAGPSQAKEWLGNLVEVSVGAALRAAQAWWPAGAWVLSAPIKRAIRWRGRSALASKKPMSDS